MNTLKQSFKDFGRAFLIQKFPSYKLALPVLLIFIILVICGSYFFDYRRSALFPTPSAEYTLFIKIIPKIFLLILIIGYNLHNKSALTSKPQNLLGYSVILSLLILIFFIFAFLCKEFAGKLVLNPNALKCLPLPSQIPQSIMDIARGQNIICAPQMPEFFIRSIPAIFLTAYFQLTISNMISLLLINIIKREK